MAGEGGALRLEQLARIKPAARLLHKQGQRLESLSQSLDNAEREHVRSYVAKVRHITQVIDGVPGKRGSRFGPEFDANLAKVTQLLDKLDRTMDDDEWIIAKDQLVLTLEDLAMTLQSL